MVCIYLQQKVCSQSTWNIIDINGACTSNKNTINMTTFYFASEAMFMHQVNECEKITSMQEYDCGNWAMY